MKTELSTGRAAGTGVAPLQATSHYLQPLAGSSIVTGGVYAEGRTVTLVGEHYPARTVRRVVGSVEEGS